MEADYECTNIIAVLKKIEKIRKCNKCGATELISLTGSCSHSLCSDCLRGLPDSICPECSTPFELKAILPNIQWSSFSHEINKIASLVNRVVKPPPFNNLPDEVLKDIEHGETHLHETSAEPNISEKSNKKGSIYKRKLKLASTSQNENELPKSNVPIKEDLKDINENTPVFVSNETESVDVIGNSQSPIKKNTLFTKQNVENVKKGNVLSENNLPVKKYNISRSCVSRGAETENVVRKPDKVALNSSSDCELNFKGFPAHVDCITISSSSEDGSSYNSDTYQRKKKTSLNHVEHFSRSNKRIIDKNCSNGVANDKRIIDKNCSNSVASDKRIIIDKNCSNSVARDKRITNKNCSNSVASENADLNKSCISSKNKKNIPKQSKKHVRRNSKEGKNVCEVENDSSEIIPATPQDAAMVEVLPVSTRAKKQLSSLNVNSTKRRDSVKRNRNGETPLLSACAKGNLAEVERLISEGADPNIKDYAGWTPLHEAVIKGDRRIVEALVQAGANINTPGYMNITPLLEAVLQDNHAAAAFLLRLGADRHIRSLYNFRPLDCAKGDEMIKLLNQLHAPSSGTEPATNYCMSEPFCLCPIKLNAEQCQTLRDFCVKFDLKCVESLRFEVTHAIVATQDNNVCKTDVNIFKCLANGTAVISFNWIQHSLKLTAMSKPDVWEVRGTEEFPGSEAFMKSRINSQKLLPKLLNGLHVSLSPNWSGGWRDLSKNDVMDLVKEAGAVLLKREADPHTTPEDEKTVMFHANCDGPMGICSHVALYVPGHKEPELKYNMTHHKTLSVKWLTDCLQTFSIVDPL